MDTILTRALVRGVVLNSSVHVCNRGTGCHSASYSSDEQSDVSVCTSMDTILTRALVRGVVLNSSVHVCNRGTGCHSASYSSDEKSDVCLHLHGHYFDKSFSKRHGLEQLGPRL